MSQLAKMNLPEVTNVNLSVDKMLQIYTSVNFK